ncbi:MAG: RHS repeat protein [Chloracidobacterium sp.]|nr:RHS repeat protein [Chloracidobacterium sp.]
MGNKIITEKDFWICSGGTTPAQLQSRQTAQLVKKESGHKYITVADTATSSWIDFGCKKLMWIMAILAAVVVVAVVATGGAALGALIAAGAMAGAAGAAFGAVVGGLICGQKAIAAREWQSSKSDLIIKGQRAITGDDKMKCMLFNATISFAPEIKNWWQAIALGASKYISGIMEGMMYGAAIGVGGGIISGGPAVLGEFGFSNLGANWLATWGGGGLGLRGVITTQNVLGAYGETGHVSAGDVFYNGVFGMETGTWESAKKIVTGNGTMDDFLGLALWFTPAHGRNRNEKSRTTTEEGKSKEGKNEEGKDEENPQARTRESKAPRQEGEFEAYEEGKAKAKAKDPCGELFEPIDVVTGANVDDFIDFTLPAPRFVWRRWYNSQQQEQAGLGWGFWHEYQLELRYDQSTSQYAFTDQKGNYLPFPPFFRDQPGERVAQRGYVLKRLSERRFELSAHDLPAIEFEFREMAEPARLLALRDEDRNFTFDYDEQGRLIGIRIDEQRTVRLNYSPAGLVGEVSLEGPGHEVVYMARYRYDDNGCMIEFRDALDQVARYEYDSARRMTRKTNRRGYSYHYQYDEQGRCVYTSGEDGMYEGWLEYHPEDNATVAKYSDGGSWIYEYNELGTITKITDPYGGIQRRLVDSDTGIVTRELDPAGNPTELLYDEQGAHTGRLDPLGYWAPPLDVEPNPPNPLEHEIPETPLEWEFGKLPYRDFSDSISPDDSLLADFPEVAAEIAQSRPAVVVYDRVSHSYRSENGASWPFIMEKLDAFGRPIERKKADGSTELWEYDAEGNEILYVDGDGGRHRKEYSSWNLLHREIDPIGNTREFHYSPTEEVTRFIDIGGAAHDFVYDQKDRLVEIRRDGLVHDYYRYDEADNLIEKLDGEGRSLLVCGPGAAGLDRFRRFADGEVYKFEYNARGQCTLAQTRRDTAVLDYDEEGRLIKDERDGLGVEHEFVGDELLSTTVFGKFTISYEKRYEGGLRLTDPTGRAHTFHFGENGLILKELANGTRELIQYDSEGRCLRKIVESADGERHSKSYHYSAAGDLSQVEDSRRGWVKYHYDAAHRLNVAEREDRRNELYAHDAAGNLILQPGLGGVQINQGNRLRQANGERFHYDRRDNVVLRESERRATKYEYDSFDQLIGVSLNGREWRAEYDALGRRTRKRWSGQTTEYYWDGDRFSAEIRSDNSVRLYIYADAGALAPGASWWAHLI